MFGRFHTNQTPFGSDFFLVDPFGWGFLWLSWNHLPPGQESLPGAVQLFKNLLGSDEFGLHAGQGWSAF